MKKVKYLLLLCLFAIMSTGCIKYNANMEIKKDKSMDFSIIYALDSSVFGEDKKIQEADLEELKKSGFTVEKYSEGTMEGFKMLKHFKNIDEVSSEKDTEYDLSGMMENKADNNYMFKVEKGFLKNTYYAKFKFDSSSSDLGNDNSVATDENEELLTPDENDELLTTTGGDDLLTTGENEDPIGGSLDDLDYSKLMANMDLSFNVTLPSGAKTNNATTAENGNKKLKWSLSTTGASNIEFSFDIYNMTIIYIGIGVLAVIILAVVLLIVGKSKKNKQVEMPIQPEVQNNIQ